MAFLVALATIISLPVAEYLIHKKSFSTGKAYAVALILCWLITFFLSILVKWLLSH